MVILCILTFALALNNYFADKPKKKRKKEPNTENGNNTGS